MFRPVQGISAVLAPNGALVPHLLAFIRTNQKILWRHCLVGNQENSEMPLLVIVSLKAVKKILNCHFLLYSLPKGNSI